MMCSCGVVIRVPTTSKSTMGYIRADSADNESFMKQKKKEIPFLRNIEMYFVQQKRSELVI